MKKYSDEQFVSRRTLYDSGLSPYKINKLVEDYDVVV